MIEEQAIVVRVEGDRAHLEVERSQPCGLCGTTRGCGVSLWGRLFSRPHGSFTAMNSLQLNVGDRVVVAIEERAILSAALAAYLIPLLLICFGGFVGASQGLSRVESDFYGAVGAVIGLLLGLVMVRRVSATVRRPPTMVRRNDATIIRQCSR